VAAARLARIAVDCMEPGCQLGPIRVFALWITRHALWITSQRAALTKPAGH
jgi:hypothetical protein